MNISDKNNSLISSHFTKMFS